MAELGWMRTVTLTVAEAGQSQIQRALQLRKLMFVELQTKQTSLLCWWNQKLTFVVVVAAAVVRRLRNLKMLRNLIFVNNENIFSTYFQILAAVAVVVGAKWLIRIEMNLVAGLQTRKYSAVQTMVPRNFPRALRRLCRKQCFVVVD